MRSVMSHNFHNVPEARMARAAFDRSSGWKGTFDAGDLIPVFWDLVLPGDTFKLRSSFMCRLNTPLTPVMDNSFLETFFFFVPWRLIWTNFPKFMGEQANPGDSTDYLVPQMTGPNAGAGGVLTHTLSDYFGIPTGVADITFNSFLHRSYNLIWNEWFRDENLQNSITVDKGDGPDTYSNYVIKKRGKRKDYFTSCLPWPQKGDEVTIPISGEAPIKSWNGSGSPTNYVYGRIESDNLTENVNVSSADGNLDMSTTPGGVRNLMWPQPGNTGGAAAGYYNYADLDSAVSATLNSFREAVQIQALYERDARGGTRYTEIVRSHFNVVSPDARLQRPEYLGGNSTRINISPVAKTSTDGTSPQGSLTGIGTVSDKNHGFTKSFTEHGFILGLCNVRADLNYQQGLHRHFSIQTREEVYWPSLANLGEQEVLNQEIYMQAGGTAANTQVFGYQERWAEYRYKPSIITGVFRSQYATPLDSWHFAEEFGSLPALNAAFIEDKAATVFDRCVATPSEPQFKADFYHELRNVRPLPLYSVPGMMSRF